MSQRAFPMLSLLCMATAAYPKMKERASNAILDFSDRFNARLNFQWEVRVPFCLLVGVAAMGAELCMQHQVTWCASGTYRGGFSPRIHIMSCNICLSASWHNTWSCPPPLEPYSYPDAAISTGPVKLEVTCNRFEPLAEAERALQHADPPAGKHPGDEAAPAGHLDQP
jgi:hypothetical protein